jgi:hypothetical protein
MKRKNILLVFMLSLWLISCESTVKADYDTLKTKKLILVDDDKNEYLLSVKKDSLGKPVLDIQLQTGK